MKAIIFLSPIILFLLTGCGENKKNDYKSPPPTIDSAIADGKIVEGSLVDLSNETNIQALLCQGWQLEDDMTVLENNNDAMGIYPVRNFYFFDDFTYVKNTRNFMEHGQWMYNDEKKKITLKSSTGSKDEYKIAAIGPDDMIVINSGINSVTQLKFIAAAKKYVNMKEDPFYIDNNRWRIKPAFSENDSLVRKRLKDCIHFYVLYYRDNLAKGTKQVSFYGFPTCIKWYDGGISLVKENELAENWFECFYNQEQAMSAYRMMRKVISKKYKWSTKNISWLKKNLEVLEQIHDNL